MNTTRSVVFIFFCPRSGPTLHYRIASGRPLTRALLQVCCDKVDLPGYELPEDATPFRMVPLKCCVESEKTVPGDLVAPCTDCGIFSILPDRDQCPCFSEAVLQEPVQWLKRQETLEGKKHDQIEDRLRPYQGTLGELVDEVLKGMQCNA